MPDTGATCSRAEVGAELRRLRESHGLSINALARMAGLGAGNLSNLEAGQVNLTGGCAWRIAKVLGVGVLRLCPRDDLLQHLDVRAASVRGYDEDGATLFSFAGDVRLRVPKGFGRSENAS